MCLEKLKEDSEYDQKEPQKSMKEVGRAAKKSAKGPQGFGDINRRYCNEQPGPSTPWQALMPTCSI